MSEIQPNEAKIIKYGDYKMVYDPNRGNEIIEPPSTLERAFHFFRELFQNEKEYGEQDAKRMEPKNLFPSLDK